MGKVLVIGVAASSAATCAAQWRRVASFAAHHHVKMAHHEEPQVALHLLALIPHGAFVEIFPNPKRDPMWFDLPVRQLEIVDGKIVESGVRSLLGTGWVDKAGVRRTIGVSDVIVVAPTMSRYDSSASASTPIRPREVCRSGPSTSSRGARLQSCSSR